MCFSVPYSLFVYSVVSTPFLVFFMFARRQLWSSNRGPQTEEALAEVPRALIVKQVAVVARVLPW